MTPYQRHCKRWKECKRCLLCRERKRVVLARGKIPADVLFVGEAPGASEDVLGKPFIGPAGKLLDRIIEHGIDGQADYALTNLVACIPKEQGNKMGEPPEAAIEACRPRLKAFIRLCEPKVVVAVGKLAKTHLGDLADVSIVHPAAILRMDPAQKGLAIHRCVVTIADAIVDL